MLNDPLFPLAAAVLTKDLNREESVALTAAAAVIQGPLALAPAVVALEHTREKAGGTSRQWTTSAPSDQQSGETPMYSSKVEPELKPVPDLMTTATKLSDAIQQLDAQDLKSRVVYHYTSDSKKDQQVLRQQPAPGEMTEEGKTVTLDVGKYPPPPGEQTEAEQIAAAISAVLGPKLDAIAQQIAALPGGAGGQGNQGSAAPQKKPG